MAYRETREDRNKRIALEAITLAGRFAELTHRAQQGQVTLDRPLNELEDFHRRWESREVHWTRGGPLILDHDEWASAQDIAEQIDRTPELIRQWHSRGYISSMPDVDGKPLYNVGEVVACEAQRRTKGDVTGLGHTTGPVA